MATTEPELLNEPNFPKPFFTDFMFARVEVEPDAKHLSGIDQYVQARLFGTPASTECDRRHGHLELLFQKHLQTLQPDIRLFCATVLTITVLTGVPEWDDKAKRHPTISLIEEPALAGIRLQLHRNKDRGVYAVHIYDDLVEGTMAALSVNNDNMTFTESVLWGDPISEHEPATVEQLVVTAELVERLLRCEPIRY